MRYALTAICQRQRGLHRRKPQEITQPFTGRDESEARRNFIHAAIANGLVVQRFTGARRLTPK
jgi:hypothetical protein